ncbi:MAG: hypothetical protein JJT89_18085 [Nitriliruptoraceae bacterium]|nr:hypothetical protein [Nitriliruptoraceae bacterium]
MTTPAHAMHDRPSPSPSPSPGPVATAIADPRYDRFRNPRWRRRLSVAQLTATAALIGVGAAALQLGAGPVAFPVALAVAFVPWMLITGTLNASVHGLTEIRDADLDELQRRIRDAVYRRAYRIVSTVVVVLAVVAPFAAGAGLDTGPALVAGALLFALVIGLPVHLLAWTLPDDEG